MVEDIQIVCPHCGQSAAVSRVSTVYEKARTSPKSGILAKKLAPPPKPLFNFIEAAWRKKQARRTDSIPFLARVFLSLFMAALLVPMTVLVFGAVLATGRVTFNDFILPVAGVALLIFFMSYGVEDRQVVIYSRDDERTSWEKALRRWKQLYYCALCDSVFLPGESSITPAQQLRAVLFRKKG